MRFRLNYEREAKIYEARVVGRKFNGYYTDFPSRINGAKVVRPKDALDRYFICDDDLEIIEIADREKNMEVEL